MKNKTVVKCTFQTLAAASTLVCGLSMVWAPMASADITFEDRGARFSVDVRDEPIADVMDELSERFDFKVDGYPEHWSDEPMSFSATGDLERVLRSLLKDTSHVFEYHTDLDTRETRIASLKLLNEGVEGFVPALTSANNTPKESSSSSNGANPTYGTERSGTATIGADPLTGDLPVDATDPATSSAARANGSGNGLTFNAPASGLSQTLEARARQSSGTAFEASDSVASSTPSRTTPGNSSNPATNVSEAEMRALTQRALQDVKGLADALRKAEGK